MLNRVTGSVAGRVKPSSSSSPLGSLSSCSFNDFIPLFRCIRCRHHHHHYHQREQRRRQHRCMQHDYNCWSSCSHPSPRTSRSSVTAFSPSSSLLTSSTPCSSSPSNARSSQNPCQGNESKYRTEAPAIGDEAKTTKNQLSCPQFHTLCSKSYSDRAFILSLTKSRLGIACLSQSLTLLSRLLSATTSTRLYSTSNKELQGKIVSEEKSASGEIEKTELNQQEEVSKENIAKRVKKSEFKNNEKITKNEKKKSSSSSSSSSSDSDSDDDGEEEAKVIADQKNKRKGVHQEKDERAGAKKKDDQPTPSTAASTAGSGGGDERKEKEESSDDEDGMNDEILGYLRSPKKVRFGVAKVILTIVAGIYAGAFLAKFGANLLEEYEIFVKEDDDDD